MKPRKGFTGKFKPGRHTMEARGGETQNVAELSTPRSGTYAVVPAKAASDRRLGLRSPLHVLVLLGRYRNAKTGVCVPAVERIAAELGLKRRAVQQHIKKLLDCGYLTAIGRRRENGGWSSNAYTLLFPALPGEPDDGEEDGGGHPAGSPEDSPSEPVLPSASDAQANCAYPPSPGDDPVEDHVEGVPPMRSPIAQGDAASLRNPCARMLRMNNSPILTIDSNSPFAEANARARPMEGHASDGEVDADTSACPGERSGMRVEAPHEAQQEVPLAKARAMYQPPAGDPIVELVRRLSRQTGISEGALTVHMLIWHGLLAKTGIDAADAQRMLVAIGRPLGYGKLNGDPVAQIDARVRTWAGRRAAAA